MLIARWLGLGLAAAASITCTGSAAWAQSELGWYYGVSGGQSRVDISQSEMDELADFVLGTAGTPLSSSSTLEDSDTTWSLFFGYKPSQYFAFEAGYADLGSFPYRQSGTIDQGLLAGVAPSSFGFDFEAAGFPMSAIGILPLGPAFDLHARVGLVFSETEARFTASAGNDSLDIKTSGNSSDLFYGVGAAFNLGYNWSISIDWVQYQDVGDDELTWEADIDSLSLALIYRVGPF